jgi:hypothetical protein
MVLKKSKNNINNGKNKTASRSRNKNRRLHQFIRKSSGSEENFSEDKLLHSLMKSGAGKKIAKKVIARIMPIIEDKKAPQLSTKKIHQMACQLLRRESKRIAALYNLDRAIMSLGPDGFAFEKFMAELLRESGYKTKLNCTESGQCIRHEVDIIVEKNRKRSFIECKFHNSKERTNDVKVVLYIQARHLDLKANTKNNYNDYWLISNTKFSKDAIQYAQCVGLRLIGQNWPEENAISSMVAKSGLYPITSLTRLKKSHQRVLLDKGIIFCRQLRKNRPLLKKICSFEASDIEALFAEIDRLEAKSTFLGEV